jgi:hypothetical protein
MEGDVNATVIATNSILNVIYYALDASGYIAPIFGQRELCIYLTTLESLGPVQKTDEDTANTPVYVDFEESTPGEAPDGVTSKFGSQGALITKDVGGEHGNVASYKTVAGGGDYLYLKNGGSTMGSCYVFETDIRFDSAVASNPRETLGWFGMNAKNSIVKEDEFLPLHISVDIENGESTALRIRNNNDDSTVAVIPKGEWHNLRFVYTANNTVDDAGNVTKYKGNVEVFLDNVSVATYATAGYTISQDPDNEANNVFDNMIFQLRGRSSSTTGYLNMSFDNIFLGTFTK